MLWTFMWTVMFTFRYVHTTSVKDVHFWSQIHVNQPAICQLAKIVEQDYTFINEQNQTLDTFIVNNQSNFGLVLGKTCSFAMLFGISCMVQILPYNYYPRSVFLVGANGPNQPIVNLENYDGANATYDRNQSCLFFHFAF